MNPADGGAVSSGYSIGCRGGTKEGTDDLRERDTRGKSKLLLNLLLRFRRAGGQFPYISSFSRTLLVLALFLVLL